MTRERLKKLIKQEKTVYEVNKICGGFEKIELSSSNYISVGGRYLFNKHKVGAVYCLNNLYETKERAAWALKTVAERTERFEPPMWEDIENCFEFSFKVNHLHNGYEYSFFVTKDCEILIRENVKMQSLFEAYAKDATKENYEKACEIVRDLFKGEK